MSTQVVLRAAYPQQGYGSSDEPTLRTWSTVTPSGSVPTAISVLEPSRGCVVRARFADHHTAGYIFTRDDREGHGDPVDAPMRWWAHESQKWISWPDVLSFVSGHEQKLELEVLRAPTITPAGQPDGAHGAEHCGVS